MNRGNFCSVGVCNNSSKKAKEAGENDSFFTFPKDANLKKLWALRCYRKDKFNPDTSRICSRHFTPDDYEDSMQARLMGFRPKKLKKDAIPSLLLHPQEAVEVGTKRPTARKSFTRKERRKLVIQKSTEYETKKEFTQKERKELVDELIRQSIVYGTGKEFTEKERKKLVDELMQESMACEIEKELIAKERKKLVDELIQQSMVCETEKELIAKERKKLVDELIQQSIVNETEKKRKELADELNCQSIVSENEKKSIELVDELIQQSAVCETEKKRKELSDELIEQSTVCETETEFTQTIVEENIHPDFLPLCSTAIPDNPSASRYLEYEEKLKRKIRTLENRNKSLLTQNRIVTSKNSILQKKYIMCEKERKTLKQNVSELGRKLTKVNSLGDFVRRAKTEFKDCLTPNQIEIMLKLKTKVRWSKEELLKAYTLRRFNKRSYVYLKNKFHYPLPGLSTLRKWAAHTGIPPIRDDTKTSNFGDHPYTMKPLPNFVIS